MAVSHFSTSLFLFLTKSGTQLKAKYETFIGIWPHFICLFEVSGLEHVSPPVAQTAELVDCFFEI